MPCLQDGVHRVLKLLEATDLRAARGPEDHVLKTPEAAWPVIGWRRFH